jgi:proline iminopeptidase
MSAAKHWAQWEAQCATLQPSKTVCERLTNAHTALSISLMETHYFMQQSFLAPNQILRDMPKIAHLPAILVHGRYDMLCPLDNAYALHKAWPGSQLQVIRDAGHSSSESGIIDALVNATEMMSRQFL